MSLALSTTYQNRPQPKFGQINLERFYDNEGAQHSYLEIDLSKNRYDYYFSHQINSTQNGPIPAITTLTERYQPQNLTLPTVFSGFKQDLLNIVNQAKQAFPQSLDDYSKDELASLTALLTRPDSYIHKNREGDYFLNIPHSNNALRSLEGLPPPGLPRFVQWPPPAPTMGYQPSSKPAQQPAKISGTALQPPLTPQLSQ